MKTGPTDRLLTQHFPAQKKILYCVLNWGLGHATRSIPVIEALLQKGNDVTLASDGMPLDMLRRTFPNLQTIALPAYDVKYPRPSIVQNMLLQAWPIFNAIRKENKAVKKLYDKHGYDYIISDNRPGCYHPAATSVFISHQLQPYHPLALLRFAFKWVNRWYYRHFDVFWIPDDEAILLSGDLSTTGVDPSRVKWIGLCSGMETRIREPQKKITLLLSGPEPQRSLLENRLIKALQPIADYTVCLVRGTTEAVLSEGLPDGWEVIPLADAAQVNQLLLYSTLVVCRSGYSTLTDLVVTGCPALLIPTPGQTEQEYLARLHERRWPWVSQDDFSLDALTQVLGAEEQ